MIKCNQDPSGKISGVFQGAWGRGPAICAPSAHSLNGTSHHRVSGALSLLRRDEMRERTHFEKL